MLDPPLTAVSTECGRATMVTMQIGQLEHIILTRSQGNVLAACP